MKRILYSAINIVWNYPESYWNSLLLKVERVPNLKLYCNADIIPVTLCYICDVNNIDESDSR